MRPWHGFYAQYAFTWESELTDAESTAVNDVFNLPVQKAISGSSLPLVSAILFNYNIPALSSNKLLRTLQKDWTLGGSFRYQSGLPILSPLATNNLQAVLPRNTTNTPTYADRVPGVPLFTDSPNCHCFDPSDTFILNPAAWTRAAGRPVRHRRAVLQRLSMAAAAIRECESRTHLPYSGGDDSEYSG